MFYISIKKKYLSIYIKLIYKSEVTILKILTLNHSKALNLTNK
jgi:hypothetical protein